MGLDVATPGHGFVRGGFGRFLGGACRELFAGSGALSRALGDAGCWVEPYFEAYPTKGCYVAWADLDVASVRETLIQEIRSKFLRFCHFGLPCKGWGPANRLNGGARTMECPGGVPLWWSGRSCRICKATTLQSYVLS